MKIKIADRLIGEGEPVFIIAEIGSNHNNNISQAKEMIDVARDSGADAVKFQIYSADTLYPKSSKAYPILKEIEINRDYLADLTAYANKRGIIAVATPFDYKAIDQMDELKMPAYKWASPEIRDLPLLKYAAKKRRPIILSTGMCNLSEIQEAVDALYSEGNNEMALLHCVSLYPTEARFVNLRMMDTLRAAFNFPVGFSDHTLGISIPIAAVARGANIIEKHYTISRKLNGPDHGFALEPEELRQMVRGIRDAELSLGSPVKSLIQGHEDRRLNCRSVVSAQDISKGTLIASHMITTKRSSEGIEPKYFDIVVGRRALVDIKIDVPITWGMI